MISRLCAYLPLTVYAISIEFNWDGVCFSENTRCCQLYAFLYTGLECIFRTRNLSYCVGSTRNTVIWLGCSRIGLAVLILHAAGAGLGGRPAVISGRYNKCHSLQLQNNYTHFPPLQRTHIHANTTMRNWSWEMIMGFDALCAGRGRRNPVWSGKEAHWSLREWMVKVGRTLWCRL